MADANELWRRYESLKNERQPWVKIWDEVAEQFAPYGYKPGQAQNDRNRESLLNGKILDTVGVQAARTLAAGMQGGMTSPARPWFRLRIVGDNERQFGGTWLDDVEQRMQTIFHRSNLYNSLHVLYQDMGMYGTGVMVETADEYGISFEVLPAGTYVLDTDNKGRVDTLMYSRWLTLRQLVQEYGEKNLPESMQQQIEVERNRLSTAQTLYEVVQCIFPRRDSKPGAKVRTAMPWASVHMLMQGGGRSPEIVRESGFMSFPAFCPRWELRDSNVYGYSPAMQAMADCRMAQAMQRTSIKAYHRMSDPPMSVNSSLQSVGLDLSPAALNYVDWTGQGQAVAATPILQADPSAMQAVEQAKLLTRQAIEQAMYSDLFRMLLNDDRRQITATEIEAKQQEKMILIGPVVERLDKELLTPLIERTYELMAEYDYLPESPDTMGGGELRVEFVSVLAQAQKLLSTSNIDQTMAFVANLSGVMPDLMDNISPDDLLKAYAQNLGAPMSIFRTEAERDKIRQQRQQAQQAAQQQAQGVMAADQAKAATDAAKNLGQTPVGADGATALDAILGGMGAM